MPEEETRFGSAQDGTKRCKNTVLQREKRSVAVRQSETTSDSGNGASVTSPGDHDTSAEGYSLCRGLCPFEAMHHVL